MRVYWSRSAVGNLSGIYNYLAKNSSPKAEQILDHLIDRSRQLSQFPLSGRKVPEWDLADYRELVIAPYRLIYRVHEDSIEVLAVIHGRRQFPPDKDLPIS